MHRFLLASVVLGLVPSLAEAAPLSTVPGEFHSEHRDIVVEVGPDEADFLTPGEAQAAHYYLLYLNRCEGGETITPGFNDSRNNTSSIPNQAITFPEYPYGDASWNQVVSETRSILSPFGIEITDQDPGDTPHTEIIACGQSFVGANVLGIAPFGCGLVANAIGYAFAENHSGDPRQLAETIAHEAGHTWTLNHLYDCADPMTYLEGCGDKAFQNVELDCAGVANNGAWQRESCTCGGGTQNSFRTLIDYFGPNDFALPTLNLESPANEALVGPGFAIRGNATGMNGEESIEVYIDDVLQSRFATTGAIDLQAPEDINDGPHTVRVVIVDQYERRDEVIRDVSVSAACQCGDGEYCDGEQCLPFGAVGDACDGDATCKSGLCASSGETSMCTARCTPGADTCENGTSCVETESGGLCWVDGDNSGCGCQSSNSTTASIWGLLLLGLFFRRRRRQA